MSDHCWNCHRYFDGVICRPDGNSNYCLSCGPAKRFGDIPRVKAYQRREGLRGDLCSCFAP